MSLLGCLGSSLSSHGLDFYPVWVLQLLPLPNRRTPLSRPASSLAMASLSAVPILVYEGIICVLVKGDSLTCFLLNVLLLTGGFGSYLIAMDERTYQLIGPDYPGNRAEDVKNPGLAWMIGFMFVVSFLGLFSLVPLRKVVPFFFFALI